MVCIELVGDRWRRDNRSARVDRGLYDHLPLSSKSLISQWLERAKDPGIDSFASFIYAWIAFNAWAACVTEKDGDTDWRNTLALDVDISRDFSSLLRCEAYRDGVRRFHDLWPVFKVQELRRLGILRHESDLANRQTVRDLYLQNDPQPKEFQPRCWLRHRDAGKSVAHDWPHTLFTLYRVRCNLFHGEKQFRHSEMDTEIVDCAGVVLAGFLTGAGYLD